MIRYECLELLAGKMTDQLVVTSQSGQRIEWSHLSKHEGNLLVGMMGCAVGVGLVARVAHLEDPVQSRHVGQLAA